MARDLRASTKLGLILFVALVGALLWASTNAQGYDGSEIRAAIEDLAANRLLPTPARPRALLEELDDALIHFDEAIEHIDDGKDEKALKSFSKSRGAIDKYIRLLVSRTRDP